MGALANGNHLIKEVPQGSVLGPLFFNVFINYIFLFIQEGSLHNFADDNTISISAKNAHELHRLTQLNSNECIEWFNSNYMTAIPSKFQSLIVGKYDSSIKKFQINSDLKINVINEVTFVGIHIDKQLKFDSRLSKLEKSLQKSSHAPKCDQETSSIHG